MPSPRTKTLALHIKICVAVVLLSGVTAPARAQYPGMVKDDKDKKAPTPRAIAVLEWVGEAGKPSASRIVPVTVFDQGGYQDGGLYLAKPEPLAVESGTEYVLQQAGVAQGIFDIFSGQDVQGSWFGYGVWKPLVVPAPPKLHPSKVAPQVVKDADPDRPHFKTGGDTAGKTAPSTSPANSTSKPAPPPTDDPDRPTLHRRTSTSGSDSSSGTTDADSAPAQPPPDDPDRPRLKKHSSGSQSQAADSGAPVTAANEPDPDRPRLSRGRPPEQQQELEATKLTADAPDLQQMIAVSDATSREPHPFLYKWADPNDAAKAKTALEEIARTVLANSTRASFGPAAAAVKPRPTSKATTTHRTATARTPTPPAAFSDEQFKAYELSYSGGATLVFTAKSGDGPDEKYVTIIAQPDFYGYPQVRMTSVTDAEHLDVTPRLRLVDAVDTDGDNRAELVFELRGKIDRQFAIYKVAGARATVAFTTTPVPYGTATSAAKKAD